MPRTYTPVIKFANSGSSGSAAFKNMRQRAEPTQHLTSDHARYHDDYSGVVRKSQDFRDSLIPYKFKPVPTRCVPDNADPAEQAFVRLTGSNFSENCRVFFDGVETISTATFIDPNHLEFIAPDKPGAEEDLSVQVLVLRPDGMSGTADGIFWYEKNPILRSVTPSTGYTHGGTISTLEGFYFKDNSSVSFRNPSTGIEYYGLTTWFNSNHIDVAQGPEVPETGTYELRVVSPSGRRSEPLPFYFEWDYPVISSFYPNIISSDESKFVQVTGLYFQPGIKLVQSTGALTVPTFSGTTWNTASTDWRELPCLFVDGNTVYATMSLNPQPSASVTSSIMALHTDGKMSDPELFRYALGLPAISDFQPKSVGVGTTVYVTGTHLSSSTQPLLFNVQSVVLRRPASTGVTSASFSASFVLVDQNHLTFTVPTGTSFTQGQIFYVRVSSSAGSAESTQTGTFSAAPQIVSIAPSTGGIAGGFNVLVFGNGFRQETTFTIGPTTISATFLNDSYYSLLMPQVASTGTVYISASNPGTSRSTIAFQYAQAASMASGNIFFPSFG